MVIFKIQCKLLGKLNYWEKYSPVHQGPGEVHLTLGDELAGRAEVREECEHAGETAEGGPGAAGSLLHAGHDDSLTQVQ